MIKLSKNNKKPKINILFSLLKKFTRQEIKRFSLFINSNYFNTDQYLVKLLETLTGYLERNFLIDSDYLSTYNSVFGKRNKEGHLTQKEIKLLQTKMSVLLKLAKRFLVVEHILEKPVGSYGILSKELLKKNQSKLIQRQIVKDRKVIKNDSLPNIDIHISSFFSELGYYNFLLTQRNLEKNNLEKLNYHLDMFYILQKQKTHSTLISINNTTQKKTYDLSTYKLINPIIKSGNYENNPVIILNQQLHQFMLKGDSVNDFKLLDQLEYYKSKVSLSDLSDYYFAACNYCIRRIQGGDLEYYEHNYNLYKSMDKKNMLLDNGFMDITRLKNCIGLAGRFGDFKWANELIEKYIDFTNHQDKKSVYHFTKGSIAFYQNKYEEALEEFKHVRKISSTYDANLKTLILKCIYESNEDFNEYTLINLTSTESYFKNNKTLNIKSRNSYVKFIKVFKKIYLCKYRVNKTMKHTILQDMEKQHIHDKVWLLEKLKEIK